MIDRRMLKELEQSLGKTRIKTSVEYKVTYSYDASEDRIFPSAVVFPESEEHVKNCLQIASKYKVPVVPRGAGIGYTGGSVPVEGSISLVFTKMNKIICIDEKSLIAIVEPGVVTYDLQKLCEKRGLFYPPDPASLKTSTIGGNVSENAGGPRCFKYGVTSNYVIGIEGYLVNGDHVKFGSSSIKDVAGYDITSLITGSEGTLMIITKILLRLIPLPSDNIFFRFNFDSLKKGANFIENILRKNILPSVLEFMDKSSIEAVYDYMEINNIQKPEAVVLMELDGEVEEIEAKIPVIKKLSDELGVSYYKIATNDWEKEQLWEIRRSISPAITKIKPKKINEDISVPRGKIPETVEFINSLSEETGIKIIMFGHFGDGNIHTNIMIDPKNPDEVNKSEYILDKIFRYVVSIDGSISGEHGIGTSKKRFLKYQYGREEIEIFKKIKRSFDPDNLLNPGKIF